MRKVCTKCCIEKDTSEFYNKEKGLHGKHSSCKKCLKESGKIYREKNPEKIRIKERLYRDGLREKYGSDEYKTRVDLEERSIIGFEKYAEKKMKSLACRILNYGIREKFIEKPGCCSVCNSKTRIEGHHPDYSKPLQVVWVCIECHSKFHTQKR